MIRITCMSCERGETIPAEIEGWWVDSAEGICPECKAKYRDAEFMPLNVFRYRPASRTA